MSEFAYKTSSQQNSNPHISREYHACAVCKTYEDRRTDARPVDIINGAPRLKQDQHIHPYTNKSLIHILTLIHSTIYNQRTYQPHKHNQLTKYILTHSTIIIITTTTSTNPLFTLSNTKLQHTHTTHLTLQLQSHLPPSTQNCI